MFRLFIKIFVIVFLISCYERKALNVKVYGNIEQIIINKQFRKSNYSLALNKYLENDRHKKFNESKQEIKFKDNNILSIEYYGSGWSNGHLCSGPKDKYELFYKNEFLDYVIWTSYYECSFSFQREILPKEFNFSFDIEKPDFNYSKDSIIRNQFGDISKINFYNKENDIIRYLNVDYKYDSLNNWTQRNVFDQDYLIEISKRKIKYSTKGMPSTKYN